MIEYVPIVEICLYLNLHTLYGVVSCAKFHLKNQNWTHAKKEKSVMTNSERENFEQYIGRMEGNLKYKLEILKYIPNRSNLKVLDFGCGSGILSKHLKDYLVGCEIHALDSSIEMLKIAKENDSAHRYFENVQRLQDNKYDVIILSSVLHEISDKKLLMRVLSELINKDNNGRIIVRDGYISDKDCDKIYSVYMKDVEEAMDFYELAGNSLVGNLEISFCGNVMIGYAHDVRNFLQTYTWGFKSLHREKDELHLIKASDFEKFSDIIGCETYEIQPICQDDYFEHLKKIVNLSGDKWDTHAIVVYGW